MNVKNALIELWAGGFFEEHRQVGTINKELLEKHGVTCSNTTMVLKTCKDILRRDSRGWIQKQRFSQKNQQNQDQGNIFQMSQYISDQALWGACKTAFESEEYWNACLHALRHLETRIRDKARLPPTEHGIDLVNKAFNSRDGILKIPSCATTSEEDGFQLINRGIVLFHRNAKGHREGNLEREDAIKIIGYVDYLLMLILPIRNLKWELTTLIQVTR